MADDTQARRASVEFMPCADEAELLTEFWEVAVHYDSIVTFNGRGFRCAVYLFAVGGAERAGFAQGLAGLPLSKRSRIAICWSN